MYLNGSKLFCLFSKLGVLHRSETKNHREELQALLKQGVVQKRRLKRNVYYQLTQKSLPFLEHYRELLVSSVRLQSSLYPRSPFYRSLLNDLRFMPEKDERAEAYLFLGDWQLKRPPTPLQLELAQERYFDGL